MKPTVGRVVLVRSNDRVITGCDERTEVPGIVTAVHSDTLINAMIMRDGVGATPMCFNLIDMEDDRTAFERHHVSWRWMDYQTAVAKEREAAGLTPVS